MNCYKIRVARKVGKQDEEMQFVNRRELEARQIVASFAPGSRANRVDGWKVTKVEPMRCHARTSMLGRSRSKRRRAR